MKLQIFKAKQITTKNYGRCIKTELNEFEAYFRTYQNQHDCKDPTKHEREYHTEKAILESLSKCPVYTL